MLSRPQIPRKVKRLLLEYAAAAHEEELRRALLAVSSAFDDWKAGRLGTWELSDKIHEFHQGPSRELYKFYTSPPHEMCVASAIVKGILDRETIPGILLDHLATVIEFCEANRGED